MMMKRIYLLLLMMLVFSAGMVRGQSYRENSGVVVIEAENFLLSESAEDGRMAEVIADAAGSGGKSLFFKEMGDKYNYSKAPKFHYPITFATTGIYYVWVRSHIFDQGWGGNHSEHYVALNDEGALNGNNKSESYDWNKAGFLEITETGIDTLNLAFEHDGQWIDKIIITTDFAYEPDGEGPAADMMLQDDAKSITYFGFEDITYPVEGVIDEDNSTITVTAAHGTDVTSLEPTIVAPYGATVTPTGAQNFSSPVTYTVEDLNGDTRTYEVSVNVLPAASSDKEITMFDLDKLEENITIGDGTITIDYYKGYDRLQIVSLEASPFATVSPGSGTALNIGQAQTFVVTAQDGSTKNYQLVWNEIEGVRSFADDYSTDAYLLWTDGGSRFQYSWDDTNERLDLVMNNNNTYFGSEFEFPEMLNLAGAAQMRWRIKSNTPISQNGFEFDLQDANGTWSQSATYKIENPTLIHEVILDFSDKLQFSEDPNSQIDITKITKIRMRIDRSAGSNYSTLWLDDFRIGVSAAVANKAPTIDPVKKPAYIEVTDGEQLIELTGITDGDPDKEQTLTISVASSDEAVATATIKSFDPVAGTATIGYTPAGTRGFSTLHIVVQDDAGAAYSDETDTAVVDVLIEVRDPSVNNPPSFVSPSNLEINVLSGANCIILANIDDGDDDKNQSLSFTVTNSDDDILTIDSLKYDAQHKVALLYVTEQQIAGTTNITVDITDDGGSAGGGSDSFSATFPTTVKLLVDIPGANYTAYDYEFWRPIPYRDPKTVYLDTVVDRTYIKGSQIIPEKDMFWMRLQGYIVPQCTGDYIFTTEDHEGSFLYLSTDHTPDNMPPEDSPTASKHKVDGSLLDAISAPIHLEAGNIYYFEAYDSEVVLGFTFAVEWMCTACGIAEQPISSDYLKASLDINIPTAPQNLQLKQKGTNDLTVEWTEATDDNTVDGYDVYLDGVKVNNELLSKFTLEKMITGLEPNTSYTVLVRAVDEAKNVSYPSNLLTVTTYDVDTEKPEIPQNVAQSSAHGLSVELCWDAATDGQTEVRGYNVYFDGDDTPINSSLIPGTCFWVTDLEELSSYDFVVTAVDAALNESDPSSKVTAETNKFCPTCNDDGMKKARVKMTLNPIGVNDGFGVNAGYHTAGVLTSNKVHRSYFEDPRWNGTITDDLLEDFDKERKAGVQLSIVDEENGAYDGQSLKMTVAPAFWFRNKATNILLRPGYTYLLRFAMKKAPDYDGNVGVKIWYQYTTTAFETQVTPTEEWQMFELEFTSSYEGPNQQWWIDFTGLDAGNLYIDDVELHIKDFYDPNEPRFNTLGIEYLQEMKAPGVRWGAVQANHFSLKYNSGYPMENQLTYADILYLSNTYLDGNVYYGTGTAEYTDFYQNPQTHADFLEYLGGPASSQWGAVREAEGYGNLLTDANHIIWEFGNEVWGGSHGAADELQSNQEYFGEWCNDNAEIIEASPYYDPKKIITAYSGGHPTDFRVTMADIPILRADKTKGGIVDMLSIDGYMSGNYNEQIDESLQEIEYHKRTFEVMAENMKGVENHLKYMLVEADRVMPMYMYEGTQASNAYNARVGQAVNFTDYWAGTQVRGVAHHCLFHFTGGVWRMVDITQHYKKLPQFYAAKYYNSYCKGVMLETITECGDTIVAPNPRYTTLLGVGAYSYTKDNRYTVMLTSRDFENDYTVQVDVPDELTGMSATGTIYTLGSNQPNGYAALDFDISEEQVTFKDSLMVTVPKHSLVFVVFQADPQTFDEVPMASLGYKEIETVTLTAEDGITSIDEPKGTTTTLVSVNPDDALLGAEDIRVVADIPDNIDATLNGKFLILKAYSGKGTVTVNAYIPGQPDTPVASIDYTINLPSSVDEQEADRLLVYPNPADDIINVRLPNQKLNQLTITNVTGQIMRVESLENKTGKIQLQIGDLAPGVYFLQVKGEAYNKRNRFIVK